MREEEIQPGGGEGAGEAGGHSAKQGSGRLRRAHQCVVRWKEVSHVRRLRQPHRLQHTGAQESPLLRPEHQRAARVPPLGTRRALAGHSPAACCHLAD